MKHSLIITALFWTLIAAPAAADVDSWRPARFTCTLPGREQFVVFRFEYNNKGDVTRMVESINGKEISGYWIFEYSTGSYVISLKNKDNVLINYRKYTHDKKGKALTNTRFNNTHVMEETEKYYYDNELLVKVEVFNPDMKLIETRMSEYKNSRLYRVMMMGPDGMLNNYLMFEYDARGNKTSMINFGSDNSVIFRVAFEYEKGPLSEKAYQYLAY
jgi:hypothetical protein